jgi:asparagine synthase (glutamine-hydrolysing)
MCGICAAVAPGAEPALSVGLLGEMLESLRHRGPDSGGEHHGEGVSLGARRLSIIDLEGGDQPLSNEDGTIVVVQNGEIYNYRELRAGLQARGHRLRSAGDTEVIAHLYEERGDACVHELRGMFGFALWDRRRRRLLAARDRLGIKPLYHTRVGDTVLIASEIKALLQHPGLRPTLDREALAQFLALKYVPAPRTLFHGISSLPPGHLITWEGGRASERRWWDLRFETAVAPPDPVEAGERLLALLQESVRLHLRSDVPVGAFLSGGLDSSAVVALAAQTTRGRVRTYAVGFDGPESELPFARLVAERFGCEHHEVHVRPDHLVDLLGRVVWHLDQPIADEACLASYILSERAAQDVKVVLTGEGGDELFAGYARHAGERHSPYARRAPAPLRRLAVAGSDRLPGLRRPKIAVRALCEPDEAARLVAWFPLFSADARAALAADADDRARFAGAAESVVRDRLGGSDARDPLARMLYVDTTLWLPDDLLLRGDKTSMAASLEARVPLLDHHVVEFAAALPPSLKLRGRTRKRLLREIMRPFLPPAILSRPKRGFPLPFSAWLRDEVREWARDLLAPATIRRRGLFDPEVVTRLLAEHERGSADHGSLIFGLATLELWHEQYLDRRPLPVGVGS